MLRSARSRVLGSAAKASRATTQVYHVCVPLRCCPGDSVARLVSLERKQGAVRCRASAAAAQPVNPDSEAKQFWRIVIPTGLALLLCNMDRICMSVAVMPMSQTYGWSPKVQGLVQAAFLWGYMATQLKGGQLADKYGGKRVIAGAIVFFSLASLLMPLLLWAVTSAPTLQQHWSQATLACVVLVRFLVGFGEGVVLPSMNSLVATSVPPEKKARALGSIFSGFHCGNLVGLLLSPLIILHYGWQGLFVIFGALGAPLLALWHLVMPAKAASATPANPPGVPNSAPNSPASDSALANADDTAARGAMSSRASPASTSGAKPPPGPADFLRSRAVWAIVVANFVNHWGYFIYLSWIPTYFARVHSLNLSMSSFMAFVPWIAMAVGSSLAGLLADALTKRFPVQPVRRSVQAVAFTGPAIALLLLTAPNITPNLAVGLFVAALGVSSLGQAGFVANMSDIAPKHSGQLFGLCNTFGSLAGILGVSFAGFVYEMTGSFNALFHLTACLYALGAVAYVTIASCEPTF